MDSKCKEINAFSAIKKHPIQSILFLLSWVGFFVLSAVKGDPFDTGYLGLALLAIAFVTAYFLIANRILNKHRN
jgi:hypothetical protein